MTETVTLTVPLWIAPVLIAGFAAWALSVLIREGLRALAYLGAKRLDAERKRAEWAVRLLATGEKRINVIKVIRSHTGAGLYDAKMATETTPRVLATGLSRSQADRFLGELIEVGATAEVIPVSDLPSNGVLRIGV